MTLSNVTIAIILLVILAAIIVFFCYEGQGERLNRNKRNEKHKK